METKPGPDRASRRAARATDSRQYASIVAPLRASDGSLVELPTSRANWRPERDRVVLLELEGQEPGAVFSVHESGALLGRDGNADVTLADNTVSWAHARLTLESDGAYLEDLSSRNGTYINGRRIAERTRLDDGDYLCLGGGSNVVKFSMMDEFEERALRTLFELTLRDPLTRLYNRRYFDDRLRSEFAFAQRQSTPLALLLIDIDHFKQVNDTCGHQIGDVVLRLVAKSIQRMMRPEDVLARYGGEEFIVIVRSTSLRNLEILAARICQRIQALSLGVATRNVSVTVSVGASCMGPDTPCESAEALLKSADEALYAAKGAGRNRAFTAPHEPHTDSRSEPPR